MKKTVLLLILIIIAIHSSYGKYSITKATDPNFCEDFPTSYTAVDFSINELSKNAARGFTYGQTNATLILGFSNALCEFNPGVGTVTATGTEVTIVDYTITATAITVTISTADSNYELNTLNFNGIQIRGIAGGACYIKRTGGTFKIDNKSTYPKSTVSIGDITVGIRMYYTSGLAIQASTTSVFSSSTENEILGIRLSVSGTCDYLTATAFNFKTTGSTLPGTDIVGASLYYTEQTNAFSTGILFGTVAAPNGDFTITGNQELSLGAGTYYFWLTYDIATYGVAIEGDVVDAEYISVALDTTYTTASGNPAGSRTISNNIYYSLNNGNWNDTSIWSKTYNGPHCSCAPTLNNGFVFIQDTITVNNNYIINYITIRDSGYLKNDVGRTLQITNNLNTSGDGHFDITSAWLIKNIALAGTGTSTTNTALTLSGLINIGSGTVFQTIGGVGLTIGGNITVNGTLALGTSNLTASSGSNVYVSGIGTITGTGTINFATSKIITSGSNITIYPVLNIANNTNTYNNGTVTMMNNITGGGTNATWTNNANSILYMSNATTGVLSTGKLVTTAIPNTVVYNGTGNQNIKAPTVSYHNLTLSSTGSGIKSLTAATTIKNNLEILGNAQLDIAADGNTINLYGNWINNSSNATPFNARGGTVNFTGTNQIMGSNATTFNNFNISVDGVITSHDTAGRVLVNGNWASEGLFFHNNSDITFNGTTVISGTSPTGFYNTIINSGKTLTFDAVETYIEGDLTVNGTLAHNNGLAVFAGNGNTQNIDGDSTALVFYDFQVDNLGGWVILSRPITINHALTLTNGKISTDTSNVLRLISGTTSTPGKATSFISGPMIKEGSTAFVFPVGKGTRWARIGIGALTAASTFRAEYFDSVYYNIDSLPATFHNVSKTEYWNLDRLAGTGEGIVTLYWQNAGWSHIDNCTTVDLRIAHWNEATTHWENNNDSVTTSGACTAANDAGSISTVFNVTSFSPFTFGSKTRLFNPLPIELLTFSATVVNDKVNLFWETASEINNDFFTVEKSQNTYDWEKVDIVDGAGTVSTIQYYSLIDNNPYYGQSYYRLKQTDYDGNYSYSSPVAVNIDRITDCNIFPNPATSIINVNFSSEIRNAEIRIVNIIGEISKTVTIQNKASAEINISEMPCGIYFMQIITTEKTITKKFSIKRNN